MYKTNLILLAGRDIETKFGNTRQHRKYHGRVGNEHAHCWHLTVAYVDSVCLECES